MPWLSVCALPWPPCSRRRCTTRPGYCAALAEHDVGGVVGARVVDDEDAQRVSAGTPALISRSSDAPITAPSFQAGTMTTTRGRYGAALLVVVAERVERDEEELVDAVASTGIAPMATKIEQHGEHVGRTSPSSARVHPGHRPRQDRATHVVAPDVRATWLSVDATSGTPAPRAAARSRAARGTATSR